MSAALPGAVPAPSFQSLDRAAEWFALLRSGEAREADQAQWRLWLEQSAENREAWRYVERISSRFEPIKASTERQTAVAAFKAANRQNRQQPRRRQILLGLFSCASAGLLGWGAWRRLPEMAQPWMADHRSGTGEVREILLADGTRVWLGSASAFTEDYGNGLRRLQLVAGEILVKTEADPGRAFVVDTPQGRLRALGTRFTVRLEEGGTFLAVYEGAVEMRMGGGGPAVLVQAGLQTRFSSGGVAPLAPADPAREAWTRGILIAQEIPLAEVAAELGRYQRGHLVVTPEVAGLPVFGSYPLNDPGRTLAMLESVMPIRVRRLLPWWTRIEARPGDAPGT